MAETDGWTGFSRAFTHPHTSLPAADPRVVLTAVLADACNLASYRQLALNARGLAATAMERRRR